MKLSASTLPNGGGTMRKYDSIAAAKSIRVNETNATIGHAIDPNIAAIMSPDILAYGIGNNPNVGGSIV